MALFSIFTSSTPQNGITMFMVLTIFKLLIYKTIFLAMRAMMELTRGPILMTKDSILDQASLLA